MKVYIPRDIWWALGFKMFPPEPVSYFIMHSRWKDDLIKPTVDLSDLDLSDKTLKIRAGYVGKI